MKIPRFDLIIEARAVLAGIPANRYVTDLQTFFSVRSQRIKPNPAHCDTFACGAGWLAMYPPFQRSKMNKNGLFLKGDFYFNEIEIRCGEHPNDSSSFFAMGTFLSLDRPFIEYLFDARRDLTIKEYMARRLKEWCSGDLSAVSKSLARCTDDPSKMTDKQILLRRFDNLLVAFSINGYGEQIRKAAFDVAARLAARNIKAARAA